MRVFGGPRGIHPFHEDPLALAIVSSPSLRATRAVTRLTVHRAHTHREKQLTKSKISQDPLLGFCCDLYQLELRVTDCDPEKDRSGKSLQSENEQD